MSGSFCSRSKAFYVTSNYVEFHTSTKNKRKKHPDMNVLALALYEFAFLKEKSN